MRISDLKERTACPASEHHGSPVAEASPGCGGKGAGPSWGKLWDHPLPCLALGGFQAHRFVCVYRTLSRYLAVGGQQEEGTVGGEGEG